MLFFDWRNVSQEAFSDRAKRQKLIDCGDIPAYLANVMDYSPAVLERIVPDAMKVQYLTSLFMRIMKCKWAQQLHRLHAPGPSRGAQLPEPRRMKGDGDDGRGKRKSMESGDMSDDDDIVPPSKYDKNAVYSGLEWLMLVKTNGERIASDGVNIARSCVCILYV
jgi:hypothetical protein